ncbi:MAG: Tm-1-like ATP-binding domain-containing protein [Paracoccaceae bacterium]
MTSLDPSDGRPDPAPMVYVVGTLDTKAAELAFLCATLRSGSVSVRLVNVGTQAMTPEGDVPASVVARHHPDGARAVLGPNDRGQAVAAMAIAFARYLSVQPDVAGVIGIGGGGGTAIITAGLRALPYGLPKLMVSTMASGNTAPYVGISDLIMVPAVTDLAGLNSLNRVILHNAAQAILGMVANPASKSTPKAALGLTMFGVTTPCVTAIVQSLPNHDCQVFHATGTGGQTMEKLADSGLLTGFFDITTTEVADFLLGGVLPCTADRFGAAARSGLPWIGSVGALDMVNFGPPETVPQHFQGRQFYHHNPHVTLMRTTPAECQAIGTWIASRLNLCHGPVRLLLPEAGISALDTPGGAFHDPAARDALFAALEATLVPTANRRIQRVPHHINHPAFAAACVAAFHAI